MNNFYNTNNLKETQKIGYELAKEVLQIKNNKQAVVIGLSGNLGGGKTTFLQGFAKGLGIKQKVLSPTFVIQKKFKIKGGNFYHIDCYRLKDYKDILELDFLEILKDPKNIIAVEWPEIIKKVLPKKIIKISFKVLAEEKRKIQIKK